MLYCGPDRVLNVDAVMVVEFWDCNMWSCDFVRYSKGELPLCCLLCREGLFYVNRVKHNLVFRI